MTLFDLAQNDGLELRKVATTCGGEYAGPCPQCGGRDRFRVWPAEGDHGRFWCRGCDWSGDAVDYLRKVRGLSFRSACEVLGKTPVLPQAEKTQKPTRPTWKPKTNSLPASPWRNKAAALVDWCASQLWSPVGQSALEYLKARGLSESTIKTGRLGYMPKTIFRSRAPWGLPWALNNSGRAKKLWIPAGIVIPHFIGNRVARVRIRRNESDVKSRYVVLSGSEMSPMILGHGSAWVVVESELDGLLLAQEAGDLAGVIALGSAQARPDLKTAELLRSTELILCAHDRDEAGAKAYWHWWRLHFPNSKRWPIPDEYGKDPGEAFLKGFNLQAWIMAGLPDGYRTLEPRRAER